MFEFENPSMKLPESTFTNPLLGKLEWKNLNNCGQSKVFLWFCLLLKKLLSWNTTNSEWPVLKIKCFILKRKPIEGLASNLFCLRNKKITFDSILQISQDQSLHYLWELCGAPAQMDLPLLKGEFSVQFRQYGSTEWKTFAQAFDITHYSVCVFADIISQLDFTRLG